MMQEENILKSHHINLIAIILACCAFYWLEFSHKHDITNVASKVPDVIKPDTVYVAQVPQIHIFNNHIPYKVEIQKSLDTTLRKEVEKQTIITGEELSSNKLDIVKIDTSGKIIKEYHKIDEFSTVSIDNQGNIEVKEDKKKMRKDKVKRVLRKVAVGGSFVLGYLIKSLL